MNGKKPAITVVHYDDNVDLRSIVAQAPFLKSVARGFGLKNGDAVLYTNKAQTRFRLVLCVVDSLFVCVPEMDEKGRLSTYLRISETLARLARVDPQIKLGELKAKTGKRIADMKKRQDAALARAKAKNG